MAGVYGYRGIQSGYADETGGARLDSGDEEAQRVCGGGGGTSDLDPVTWACVGGSSRLLPIVYSTWPRSALSAT